AARSDGIEAPRVLTSAACLARSADRARLCLSPIRYQRSSARLSPKKARLRGTSFALSPTTSAALRYWNMARQRYCRRLARYRNILSVSADRSRSQPRTPARKAVVLDLRKRIRARDGLSAGGKWIRTIGPSLGLSPIRA